MAVKILAFAGSNSSVSVNRKLVDFTLSYFREAEIKVLDLNDYEMPIYSRDREMNNGIPGLAHDFAREIDNCDLLIISLAEHNGAYSTAFKNIYDWVSRIKGRSAFGEKPMFLLAASPGKRGGSSVLEIASKRFSFIGNKILTTFSLPLFEENFNEREGISNVTLRQDLEEKALLVKREMGLQAKS